jgi:hypothetical protein
MPPIGTAMMMNKASTCAAESTNSLLAAELGAAAPSPRRNRERYDARSAARARRERGLDGPRVRVGDLSLLRAIKVAPWHHE